MTWYYIYFEHGSRIFYERTCGTEMAANKRVRELKCHYRNAWWTTTIIKGAFI